MLTMTHGHDESRAIIPTTDFDYSIVEKNLFQIEPENDLTEFTAVELDAATRAFGRMLQWVWQDGMKNPDGVKIRSIIVCWIFLKELRPMTLTQIAQGYGMKKQSLGRWVDQFKLDFPEIRTVHMRNLE